MALQIENSNDVGVRRKTLLLGPKGCGKTGTAATVSRLLPDDFPNHKGQVVLEDLIWMNIDEEGVVALQSLGVSCPNIIRLDKIVTASSFASKGLDINALLSGLHEAFEWAHQKVDGDERMNVIVDPISTLDDLSMGYFTSKHIDDRAYTDFNKNKEFHFKVAQMLRKLPCGYTLTSHTKAPAPIDNKDTLKYKEAKAASEGMGGRQTPAKVDITGQSVEFYVRPCSIVAPVVVQEKRVNGKAVRERVLMPSGNDFMPGSNRYERFLDAEEPANLNKLYQKIEAGLAALRGAA